MNDVEAAEVIKKIKLKGLANLVTRIKEGESLSPADLRVLNELQGELEEKKQIEPSYENRAKALRELKRQKYKIGKSKFYKDCEAGLCKCESDGRVLHASLNRYIKHPRSGLKRLDRIFEDIAVKEKTQAETNKLQAQVKLLEHQLAVMDGKYISREEFEMEFAAKIAALEAGLHHLIHSRVAEWVELVLANHNDATTILSQAMINDLNTRFNDLARIDKLNIIFKDEKHESKALS